MSKPPTGRSAHGCAAPRLLNHAGAEGPALRHRQLSAVFTPLYTAFRKSGEAMTESSKPPESDPLLAEILVAYFRELDAGRAPDRTELLARNADLADELRSSSPTTTRRRGWHPASAHAVPRRDARGRARQGGADFGDLDTQGEPHVTDFGLAKRVEGDSQLTQSGAVVGTPELWLWDAATGEPRPIAAPTRCPPDVSAVAFSPDGKRLVTASGTALVVRDAGSGEIVEEHPQAGGDNTRLFVVSFSPDGKWLAGMDSRQGVFLWAVTDKGVTPRPVHRITGRGERWSMAFSPDGKRLATADGTEEQGKYAEVFLWETGTWKEVGRLRPDPAPNTTLVGSLAFSPDGKRLAVAHGWHEGDNQSFTAGESSVMIWEVAARKQPASLSGRYHFAGMTPDGKSLVACDAGVAVVFDLATNNPRASVLVPGGGRPRRPGPGWPAVRRGEDGRHAPVVRDGDLRGAGRTPGPRRVRVRRDLLPGRENARDLWRARDQALGRGRPLGRGPRPRQEPFPGLGSSTYRLTTADGRVAADLRDDGTIHVQRTGADRPVVVPANSALRSVALSADGSRLATSIPNEARVVRVWDTRSGKPVADAPVARPWALLALSADGRVLASFGERELTFWDADTGRQRRTVSVPLPPDWDASSLRFTPDGQRLFVEAGGRVAVVGVADDFRFKLVEEGPGARLGAPVSLGSAEGRYAVAVSEDGRHVAARQFLLGVGGEIFRLLDLSTQTPREVPIPNLGGGGGQLQALRFSPDATVLATATSAGTRRTLVELRDAATGMRRAGLTVPGPVEALGVSHDHKTLGTADGRRLRLWDVASGLPH